MDFKHWPAEDHTLSVLSAEFEIKQLPTARSLITTSECAVG